MSKFFDPEGPVWSFLMKLADFVMLSCVWLLCCLPVLTIIPSSIALYDTIAHCVRGEEGETYRRFFRTFKRELGTGILMNLVFGIIFILLAVDYRLLGKFMAESDGWRVFSYIFLVAIFLPLGTLIWAVCLESRYTFTFKNLLKTSFILSFVQLPKTIVLVALFLLGMYIGLSTPGFVLMAPGLICYLQSWFVERTFQKIVPTESPVEGTEEIGSPEDAVAEPTEE